MARSEETVARPPTSGDLHEAFLRALVIGHDTGESKPVPITTLGGTVLELYAHDHDIFQRIGPSAETGLQINCMTPSLPDATITLITHDNLALPATIIIETPDN